MSQATTEIHRMAIGDIRPDPGQHRTHFDPGKLAELGESIRSLGQLSPIVVRPEGDGYRIVAGERRWRAMSAAGFAAIDAVIRELPEGDALALQAAENLARADVRPCEEGRAYLKIIEQARVDSPEVTDEEARRRCASLTGSSPQRVAFKLRLLLLPEVVQALVDEGALGEGHGQALVRLADGEEVRAECIRLARKVVAQGLSVADVKARVSAYLGERAQGSMFGDETKASPEARATRDTLNRAIGHLSRVVDLTFDERSEEFRLPSLAPNELDAARARLAGAAKHLGALLAEVEEARGRPDRADQGQAPKDEREPSIRGEWRGHWLWVHAPGPNGSAFARDLQQAGAVWSPKQRVWYAPGEKRAQRVATVLQAYPGTEVPS